MHRVDRESPSAYNVESPRSASPQSSSITEIVVLEEPPSNLEISTFVLVTDADLRLLSSIYHW